MRSPLIAFSLVAAAVSPSLAAHSNSPKFGRSVTHPRVTEVDNSSPGSLHLKRAGLGLDKLTGGNPIDAILPQGADASNSKPGASKANANSNDYLAGADTSLPFSPSNNPASAALPPSVPDPAAIPSSELGNVPVTPAEPAPPANPYGNGQQNAGPATNDGPSGRHAPSRAEIEHMVGSGGAW
ncbi:hypothetical protein DAEQUDRAFT_771535 [Daedalea quercina L-15889]|uniref:Uncharacterized protein n=1 Tax=Daedalea quercina L-15889 TaxID=1314783 RepID=A0A165UEK9_9APHY|nr:hypothetical protein DAEQUDRAFT_771535 [Daedalea quercina L-15889]